METATMGRVLTEATIENLKDVWAAEEKRLPPEKVRRIVVKDALVDTGVTMLSLPTRLIRKLGLILLDRRPVTNRGGSGEAAIYEAVRLTIQGRFFSTDVIEAPDETPVMIGHLALTALDFVVDRQSGSLIGNPAHGGEQILELY